MVHSSRAPVRMLLLSLYSQPTPPETQERCLWGQSCNRRFEILHLNMYLYMISPKVPFPLHGYFWLLVGPTNHVLPLKWLSHLAGCGHLIQPFSPTSEGCKKEGALFSSVFNSSFRILKPINSHVILLYFSAFIIILPPSILKSVKRKKRSAQVTTKYTSQKKWHT